MASAPLDRVLIVKLADIGDAVLSLPSIQALRRDRPSARIDVLTTEAGANVFRLSPPVDDVITLTKDRFDSVKGLISPTGIYELMALTMRLRRGRYDTVVLIHHLTTAFGARKFRALVRATGAQTIVGLDNGRGHFLTHRALDFGFGAHPEWRYAFQVMEAIGVAPVESRPQLEVPPDARESAIQLLRRHGIEQPFVLIHAEVGEFSPARAWPDRHFASLARDLTSRLGIPVVLVGVDAQRTGLDAITSVDGVTNLVGCTTFQELCALVQMADLVIGADSAVSHLGGAFDRPSISLFGPSNVEAWSPYGSRVVAAGAATSAQNRSIALHLDMPCSPCIYTGFRLGRPLGCRSRTCMQRLDPAVVAESAVSILAGKQR